MKFHLILFFLLTISFQLYSQEYDTIFHTENKYFFFDYKIADETRTVYEIKEIEVKVNDKDTTKNVTKIDTFVITLLDSSSGYENYQYRLSKKKWKKILFGNKCETNDPIAETTQNLFLKYNKEQKEILMYNCDKNSMFITKGLKHRLDCIEKSEDQFMKKYFLEWLNEVDDCDFQSKSLVQDLSHLLSNKGLLAPVADTSIRYSIHQIGDTSNLYSVHFVASKNTESNGKVIIELKEDTESEDSSRSKFTNSMYSIFKDKVDKEQLKKDSIRLSSIEDIDISKFNIDSSGNFIEYERRINSSILNSEMKRKKSEYKYTIKRLN